MTWDESQHPRDPQGSSTGGRFTDAERGARIGAGLSYHAPGGDVSIVKGGTQLPDSLVDHLNSLDEPVRVIYNSETNNWHIANEDLSKMDHGDFINQAMEEKALPGGDPPLFTEQVQSRGMFDIKTGTLTMYDFTDMAEELGDGPAEVRRVEYMLKQIMKQVESRSFYFKNGPRTKKAVVEWVSMLEIMGDWK